MALTDKNLESTWYQEANAKGDHLKKGVGGLFGTTYVEGRGFYLVACAWYEFKY